MKTPTGIRPALFRLTECRCDSRAGQSGFSLVELLCAILILGVSLAGLTQGITTALSSSKEVELQTSAALIAAGQIELLRADGWIEAGETEGECGDELPLYKWNQTIAKTSLDGLFEVTVEVAHTKTGQNLFELTTLLFDPPAYTATDQDPRNDRNRRRRQGGAE